MKQCDSSQLLWVGCLDRQQKITSWVESITFPRILLSLPIFMLARQTLSTGQNLLPSNPSVGLKVLSSPRTKMPFSHFHLGELHNITITQAPVAGTDFWYFPIMIYRSRNCIGRNFALMEMRLILSAFVYHFNFQPVPESVEDAKDLRQFITY